MGPVLQFPPAVVITAVIIIKQNNIPYTVGLPSGPITLNPDGSSYKFPAQIINSDGKQVREFDGEFSITGSFSGDYDQATREPIFNIVFNGLGLGSTSLQAICPSNTFNGFSNQSLIRTNVEIAGFGLVNSITGNYLGVASGW